MWHAWKRGGKCTRFWWESQKERDNLEDKDVDGRMGSEWILGRLSGGGKVDQDSDRWRALMNNRDEPAASGATDLVFTFLDTRLQSLKVLPNIIHAY
jgi:hypothetical protein